jgi:hypothetical protein
MLHEQAVGPERSSAQEPRQPWVKPVLKKGEIGVETADVGGRNFDGTARGTRS